MANSVKMSAFNSNKKCLIDSSVFVSNFFRFNNFDILVGKSFVLNGLSDFFLNLVKYPFVEAVKGFLKGFYSHFYSIFVFNNLNFRK